MKYLLSSGLLLTTLWFSTIATAAISWYDTSYNVRLQMTLNVPGPTGSSTAAWPVAISLNSTDIEWNLVDSAGDDLLFIDERNGTVVDYDLDHWDISNQQAVIWIRVENMSAGDQIPITMYYDNDTIVLPQEDPPATFQDFILVHHMEAPYSDATGLRSDGSLVSGTSVTGVIGKAVSFQQGYIDINDNIGPDMQGPTYVSFWTEAYFGESTLSKSPGVLGSMTGVAAGWDGMVYGLVRNNLVSNHFEGGLGCCVSAGSVATMAHIGMSWDPVAGTATFYNGTWANDDSATSIPALEVLGIGLVTRPNGGNPSMYEGIIDEVRVAQISLFDDFIPGLDHASGMGTLFDLCPVINTYYYDGDGDGYGGITAYVGCYERVDYVSITGDCNDDNPSQNIGANDCVVQDDFGGDGNADILIRDISGGQLFLYEMDGSTRTGSNIGGLPTVWEVKGISDFGGDGNADILIRKTSDGQLFLYEMDGSTRTGSSIGALSSGFDIAGLGDLGGDGNADIVLRDSSTGFLELYEMNGNTVLASSIIGSLALTWDVEGIADFGGDGNDDILIRHTGTGQLYLYEMDGNARTGSNIGGLSLSWNVVGVGDLGGDGNADIVIRNTSTGQLYLYEMNGNTRTGSNIGGLPLAWEVARIADYGGDGNADILIRNTSSGQLYLYEMDGNSRIGSNIGGIATTWQVEVQ